MCSFALLGGSENQSVFGVTTICLTQCNTSPSHGVDQVVDCGLWNVGPLLFNGCAKLLDIGRNWNTLSYTYHIRVISRASQTCSMGDMSGEYAGHARTGMFSATRNCCSSWPGCWSQTILEVNMLDVEVLGWCGYTWSAFVRPVGGTAKLSETLLEMAYSREMNIQFTGNSSGGHSCSQHANFTLPLNLRHLWHCAV